jgi:hypothetical protein
MAKPKHIYPDVTGVSVLSDDGTTRALFRAIQFSLIALAIFSVNRINGYPSLIAALALMFFLFNKTTSRDPICAVATSDGLTMRGGWKEYKWADIASVELDEEAGGTVETELVMKAFATDMDGEVIIRARVLSTPLGSYKAAHNFVSQCQQRLVEQSRRCLAEQIARAGT